LAEVPWHRRTNNITVNDCFSLMAAARIRASGPIAAAGCVISAMPSMTSGSVTFVLIQVIVMVNFFLANLTNRRAMGEMAARR
jgi:hypothetical protein